MQTEMNVRFGFYPGAKRRALTFSYDDGRVEDRRLVEIFNTYGMKGTFHLNSANFDRVNFLARDEVAELYRGHEIASHGFTHPWLERLPPESFAFEVLEDRRRLEALCGCPVRGMSYPWGTVTPEVEAGVRALGIRYSRTIRSTGQFNLPENFLRWDPTCHIFNHLLEYGQRFVERTSLRKPLLFYVWGHSWELNSNDGWTMIEQFCKQVGGRDDIWYATNIAIYDYMQAVSQLEFTADADRVYNRSAADCWLYVDGATVRLPAGEITAL